MKWALIIILIFVIMLIANALSQQYKDKFDFYSNLKLFLNQFKMNLSFKQEKIETFLNGIKAKKNFQTFTDCYKRYLKGEELDFSSIKILDEGEITELTDIVKNLGKHDTKSELSQLDSFLIIVEEKLTKASEDKNKLCPMILKLSLLFAIALAILLI